MFAAKAPVHPDLAAALGECKRAFGSVALFSGVVNLLMLAGPLYMLQIYDRVLSSRSVPTLIALSIFLVGAYAFQGALDLIRSRVVVRSAAVLDQRLALTVHDAVIRLAVASRHAGDGPQPVRDLDQIRGFLTGAGPIAIVDLPWVPVFLTICFLIHPWLGVASTVGAITLFDDDPADRARQPRPGARGRAGRGQASIMVEAQRRSGETIMAMGMAGALAQRWAGVNNRYIAAVGRLERRRRRLRQRIEGAAALAAVGHPRAGRLSRDPPGDDRRRHGRRLDHDGPRARADRDRDRQLARLHLRASEHHPAVGGAHARRAEAGRSPRCRGRPVVSTSSTWSLLPPGGTKPIVANVHFSLKTGRGAGDHRSERRRQDLAGARPRGHLAARQRLRAARWRRARPMGSGAARPARRLHLADDRAVRRHHLREHRQDERQAGCRCRARRGSRRRRARPDPAVAQWL